MRIFQASLLVFLGVTVACQKNPRYLGRDIAAKRLKRILSDSSYVLVRGDTLIRDKRTAILMAEAVLYERYGEDNIQEERPYELYLIDGYWVISGTLPEGADGGTFEVIFSALDGRFVHFGHSR